MRIRVITVSLLFIISSAMAATYTVTSSGDANSSGTLRWAINQANAGPGADIIAFNMSAPYLVSPTGTLPTVTEEVLINGRTQPGYAGIPLVCIDGGGTLADGLIVQGESIQIRAVRVSGFSNAGLSFYFATNGVVQACDIMSNGTYGIWVYMSPNCRFGGTDATNRNIISANSNTGIYLDHGSTTNNVVEGNYIGTTRDGRTASGNGYGVAIGYCEHNIIGGSNTASRNVISGNIHGVELENSANRNVVVGNYIGVDVTGTNALPNTSIGIAIYGEENRIGGASAAERNIISGNALDGIYLRDKAAISNIFIGNYIGADATGLKPIPNNYGIYANEAPLNFIGGTNSGERNVISGNSSYGIYLSRTSHSYVIRGNYIGVDATGLSVMSNNYADMRICSPSNVIGGTGAGARNIISGGGSQGIWLEETAHYNVIQGNYIGTDATGSNVVQNGDGIEVDSSHNTIGGVVAGAGNLISGNDSRGIVLSSSAISNMVKGNYIGVDVSGQKALSNYVGISIGSSFNEIGDNSGGRNVISGNERAGISFSGSNACHNSICGNYIGVAADGRTLISNLMYGIDIFEAPSNTIGGAGEGNVISGNDIGMRIFGNLNVCVGNHVMGNYIGTDYTGSNVVGNRVGIYVSGAVENYIGTRTSLPPNVISGNREQGIYVTKSTGNVIQANYIGTDISGRYALGNESDGIQLSYYCGYNYIGGATNGEGNLICGNLDDGVDMRGDNVHDNYVWGNQIGLGAATNDVGNKGRGVLIVNGASGNWVGGYWTSGWPANQIAYNRNGGVVIATPSVSNTILMNTIFKNYELGIDLGGDGVTENDPLDSDLNANLLQNYPAILSITNSGGWLYIEGFLNSRSNRSYHLEFFANQYCDASGYGEGEFLMGELDGLHTDTNGNVGFTNQYGMPVPPPNYVTATATDQGSLDTSEFCYRYLIDTDGDGMGDGYEYTHWGTATSGTASADSDGWVG